MIFVAERGDHRFFRTRLAAQIHTAIGEKPAPAEQTVFAEAAENDANRTLGQ